MSFTSAAIGVMFLVLGAFGCADIAILASDRYDAGTIARFTLLTVALLTLGIVGITS